MRAGVANLTVNDNYFAVVTKVKARVLAGDESHRQRDMCRSEQRITHGTAGRIGFEDVVQQVNLLGGRINIGNNGLDRSVTVSEQRDGHAFSVRQSKPLSIMDYPLVSLHAPRGNSFGERLATLHR